MPKFILLAVLSTALSSIAKENTAQINFMAETNPEVNAMLNSYEGLYLYLLKQDNLANYKPSNYLLLKYTT